MNSTWLAVVGHHVRRVGEELQPRRLDAGEERDPTQQLDLGVQQTHVILALCCPVAVRGRSFGGFHDAVFVSLLACALLRLRDAAVLECQHAVEPLARRRVAQHPEYREARPALGCGRSRARA